MDLSQFLSIAGAGAVIIAVVEAIKRALKWDQEQTSQWAGLLAMLLGIAILVTGTLVSPIDPLVTLPAAIFGGVLQGILAGSTAIAGYVTVGKPAIVATIGPSGDA